MTELYFRGDSWEQVGGLPDDAVLLVRSVGTENVRDVTEGIRAYDAAKGKQTLYFMAAERKDDVKFYVKKDEVKDITDFIKPLLGDGTK